MRLLGRIWIVVACALLLAACGNDASPITDQATPAVDQPVATPPPTPTEPEMEVGQVVWAQAIDAQTGEPIDIVSRFTTRSLEINAVIEVNDVPAGTEFSATWTINDQAVQGFDMDISASEDLDHAWIAFSFTSTEGQRFPIGQLTVVITSSEGDMREGSVEIGFAE